MSWWQFSLASVLIYLAVNLLFAVLYWSVPGSIGPTPRASFAEAFFFSVQTLSTVGYGHFYPTGLFGNWLVVIETAVSIFFTAMITGLIFVRFARPQARIVFSDAMVIATYNGIPSLQLRVANLQNQPMVEAEFRLMMIRKENILEEEGVRKFHTLKLEYDRLTIFPTALTIRHMIDESSPLHGLTAEDYKTSAIRFLASIVCIDTVIQAPLQSQNDYLWSDVRHGQRFAEIYTEHPDGVMEVDYSRLHETEEFL